MAEPGKIRIKNLDILERKCNKTQLPNNLPSLVAAPLHTFKEWHISVTPDLRKHHVHKLLQAMFPAPDPSLMPDKRMQTLVAWAEKVEDDMYGTANSRPEYFHLIAQKTYKIQKGLADNRKKRNEQTKGK